MIDEQNAGVSAYTLEILAALGLRDAMQKVGGSGVRPGAVGVGSGSRELDVLECQDFGELVEVRIAMEHRDAAMFGGS